MDGFDDKNFLKVISEYEIAQEEEEMK